MKARVALRARSYREIVGRLEPWTSKRARRARLFLPRRRIALPEPRALTAPAAPLTSAAAPRLSQTSSGRSSHARRRKGPPSWHLPHAGLPRRGLVAAAQRRSRHRRLRSQLRRRLATAGEHGSLETAAPRGTAEMGREATGLRRVPEGLVVSLVPVPKVLPRRLGAAQRRLRQPPRPLRQARRRPTARSVLLHHLTSS